MENKIEKNFFTAEEISRFFVIPLNTIYRLTRTGKLKGIKLGRVWRYLKTDIEELISTGICPRRLPAKRAECFVDRCIHPRMNCNISCGYSINIPSIKTFQSNSGSIRNISGGGVLIYDKPEKILQIEINDPMQLQFDVPAEDGIKTINTKGRVVRLAENGVGIFGVGVKFRNIGKNYQDEITNYIG